MNDRTMIKVRCDKELLYIRTISWQKKSPHRFAILRSELQKLEQEPNKRVLTSDCGSFASLRLTKGPMVHRFWKSGSHGFRKMATTRCMAGKRVCGFPMSHSAPFQGPERIWMVPSGASSPSRNW